MKPGIIERALELDEMATGGPWHIGHCDENSDCADIDSVDGFPVAEVTSRRDQSFICESRKLVPELAKRLARACEYIRVESDENDDEARADNLYGYMHNPAAEILKELEAPIENAR